MMIRVSRTLVGCMMNALSHFCLFGVLFVTGPLPANAQWLPGLETKWKSQVTKEAFDRVVECLELTSEQQATVLQLFSDHVTAYEAITAEGQAWEREIDATLEALPKKSSEAAEIRLQRLRRLSRYADQLAELDELFFENLELVLDPNQQGKWIEYQDALRWERFERFMTSVPGVKIDLRKIVESLQLDGPVRDRLEPLLADYKLAMDSMLDQMFSASVRETRRTWRRIEIVQKMNEKLRNAQSEQERDDAWQLQSKISTHEWRITRGPQMAVRQVNLTFADAIAGELPEDKIQPFRLEIQRRSNSFAYARKTPAHHYSDRVFALGSLTEDQRVAASAVVYAFDKELEELNLKSVDAAERAFLQRWNNPDDVAVIRAGQESADAFDHEQRRVWQSAIDKLYALLTPEQQKELPKPTPEGQPQSATQPSE